jgi:hypothetical protein
MPDGEKENTGGLGMTLRLRLDFGPDRNGFGEQSDLVGSPKCWESTLRTVLLA